MSAAVAIFVKTPALSRVKTRLAAGIGSNSAVRFHQLSAAAVAAVARAACARAPGLHPLWAVAEAAAADGHWPQFECLVQGAGPLGTRLARVEQALAQRHARWLFVGADAPQMTATDLLAALDALEREDFVLGPCPDGGFWLYGARRALAPADWESVPWSQPDTARRLRERLSVQGRVAGLCSLRDVDTAADLAPLAQDLRALPAPLPEQVELLQWLDAVA
ncbi:MAG TPA: TIGR04282 family arsenosugar biosynthesis glycosyltransferase [Xanthomonadaceae bacterium]|nr:TIGR04282 family arsenosugar biosynthesis glycosyltransferase [Xanthomonadaceae bacterium]